jgi:serine protease Do
VQAVRRSAFAAIIVALAATIPLEPCPVSAGEPTLGLADLIPTLLPAVVNVYSTRIGTSVASQSGPKPAAAPRSKEFLGSGIIIDAGGVIVTNNHVIANAFEISVTMQDNATFKAELLAASSLADIALLKVNAAKPLPTVKFGDSRKVRIGDPVFAIGNPLGLGGSVSAGIVSQLNRNIMLSPYDDYIQTDAAINHGNSGGPLFNLSGEVIGINTALWAPTGETGSVGLGFAMPSNIADFVVRQLRENGRLRIGFLGAHLQSVTQDIATALGLPMIAGALVDEVVPGGPADQAKLRQGDVILKAVGRELPDARAVARAIAETPIGQVVELGVWRDAKEQTVPVTVAEWPGDQQQTTVNSTPKAMPPESPDLGLQLSEITDALRSQYGLPADAKGLVVTGIAPLSPADIRGLHVGDVIESVQMMPVNTPAEFRQRLDDLRRQGKRYVLLFLREHDGYTSVALPLGSAEAAGPRGG